MFGGFAGEERRAALVLYTDAYRIEGILATRQRRLSDMLNQADDGFLVLADVVFTSLGSDGAVHRAPFAQVNLAAVLLAVGDEPVEPIPELRTPKVAENALVSIPPFEVVGRIHLFPERNPREALQELLGRFLPVTEAVYWSTAVGLARTTSSMLAVNHARAQILSPYEGD